LTAKDAGPADLARQIDILPRLKPRQLFCDFLLTNKLLGKIEGGVSRE
jgi:hypothetical protein